MKKNLIYLIILFCCFFSLNKVFADDYLEVKKLYDLYAKNILDINQLNSAFNKIGVDKENMGNLFSLKKREIISENDFIDGIKKIISNIELNKNVEDDIKINLVDLGTTKFEFQTEITIIHSFVVSDFKYGEIWNHMFVLEDEKITEITFKDSKNIDLIKLRKPKFKNLKNNKFVIRSNAIYLPDPSVGIRYDFKGEFKNNKVIGEVEITYTGSDEAGLVLLKAKTI